MDPLVCFPRSTPDRARKRCSPRAGYPFVGVSSAEAVERLEPEDGWAGAVISAVEDREAAFTICQILRKRENPIAPLLLIIDHVQLSTSETSEDLFDDFCVAPLVTDEIEARLTHLLWRTGRGKEHDIIVYGPLALNLETYQAVVGGRPLDLTFMEYELLRFLAAHPGKVFTREVLLSGSGAMSTSAAREPSTSTSGGCEPSSARSTPISSTPCEASATASAELAGPPEHAACTNAVAIYNRFGARR